jgi:hypothetical protein
LRPSLRLANLAAEHGKTDTAGGDSANVHALDIIGPFEAVGDIPTTLHSPLVGGNVVPHELENHHHGVFGDADRIVVGDLGDRNPAIDLQLEDQCGLSRCRR